MWLLIATLAVAYWYLIARVGPRAVRGGEPVVDRRHVRNFTFGLGLLWLGSDWPIHDVGEHYLLSVHMAQHLIFTLMAPPLLMLGLPPWLQRRLWGSGVRAAVLRFAGRPLLAGVIFNTVFVLSHWPAVVDAALKSEPVHFVVHAVLVLAAALMWFPVLNRLAGLPQMGYPGRMLYLFLQSVVPTVPASFLTFATGVIYKFYEEAPRAFSITAVEDQQLAGAIMKVYGGLVLWMVIVVMFFRWYAISQRKPDPDGVLTWEQVQRELERTEAPAEP